MRFSAMLVLCAGLGLASPAAAAEAIPADWVEVAAGAMFTVRAPPGTTFERVRTGDAFAGTFHGPGFDLAVEFGYHRDGMRLPQGAREASDTNLLVDEKPGAITRAKTGGAAHPDFIGLYVPGVERDVFGPLSLLITGRVARPEDAAIVERLFQSITFGYKN